MPAPTDLSWGQLNGVIPNNDGTFLTFVTFTEPDAEGVSNVSINLSVLTGYSITSSQSKGVIKALTRLLEAARLAQEKLNEGKPVGERLAAFPAPTIGNQTNGQVPFERRIVSRVELASATSIIGATA